MSLTVLKLIAFLTMLIDHLGSVLSPYGWNLVRDTLWMRQIGRIAFPIYAFCSVYGCLHTRNKLRYLERLAKEAILSAIPYTLAFDDRPQLIFPHYQMSSQQFWTPLFQVDFAENFAKVMGGITVSFLILFLWLLWQNSRCSKQSDLLPSANKIPLEASTIQRSAGLPGKTKNIKQAVKTALWIWLASLVSFLIVQCGQLMVLSEDQNVIYTFLIGAMIIFLLETAAHLSFVEVVCYAAVFYFLFFGMAQRCDYGQSWDGLFLMGCFYLAAKLCQLTNWLIHKKSTKPGKSFVIQGKNRSELVTDHLQTVQPAKINWLFNNLCALCVLIWVWYCQSNDILNDKYYSWMAAAGLFLLFFHPKHKPYPNSLRLLFYSFYPGHLAILGGINAVLFWLSRTGRL